MKILADDALPLVRECFAALGEVQTKAGRSICRADLDGVDALLVRTRTKVNAALLDGSAVRFVGSGVIGLEHVDRDYLAARNIPFASAQGCNAVSVSEYVTAALLHIARQKGINLAGKSIAIVGVGNVGSQVLRKVRALGLEPLLCDPPRQRSEGGDFVDLATALEADIVTIHTPLSSDGPDATAGMIDAAAIAGLKKETIFINAARGGIVDEAALVRAGLAATVVDCWANEPDISRDLMEAVDIATPHIAGHSYEGKLNGTTMLYSALAEYLESDATYDIEGVLPAVEPAHIRVAAAGRGWQDVVSDVVEQCYAIVEDDSRFRQLPLAGEQKLRDFENQRRSYPLRRQWDRISVEVDDQKCVQIFSDLGFRVVNKFDS